MTFKPGRAYMGSDGVRYLANTLVLSKSLDFNPLSSKSAKLHFLEKGSSKFVNSEVTLDECDYLDYNKRNDTLSKFKNWVKQIFTCPVNVKKFDVVYVKSLGESGIVVAQDFGEHLVHFRGRRRWVPTGDLEFEFRPVLVQR